MTGVLIKNVKKSYGDVHVIHDLSVEIRDGEFLVFVGPSGCGKSTLLPPYVRKKKYGFWIENARLRFTRG